MGKSVWWDINGYFGIDIALEAEFVGCLENA